MTKPSTLPLALRASVIASVDEATMPRKRGRFSFAASPSQKARGSKRDRKSSPCGAPSTSIFNSAGSPSAKLVEHAGDRPRDAGAHQHVVHARQHRAVQRGQGGELDLLQKLMPTTPPWPSLARNTSTKFAATVNSSRARDGRRLGRGSALEPHVGALAPGHEVLAQDPSGHRRRRDVLESLPHVAARIAQLQAAGQHHCQRGPGHHAELAQP